VLLLSGCAGTPTTPTEIRAERVPVPATLLTCQPAPTPPALSGRAGEQDAVALYIVQLWRAGEDCRTRLDAVRRIVEPA
jgi:hypothetical protein